MGLFMYSTVTPEPSSSVPVHSAAAVTSATSMGRGGNAAGYIPGSARVMSAEHRRPRGDQAAATPSREAKSADGRPLDHGSGGGALPKGASGRTLALSRQGSAARR